MKFPAISKDKKEPDALALAKGNPALEAAVLRARKILHRKALMAAAASSMPIPGLDWAADAALLTRLLPQVSHEFGLTPDQIEALHPEQREHVRKAIAMVGSVMIGKFITRDMVMKLATSIGVRMSSKQIAKFVPFAGQALSATIGYAALRYLGEQHLRECVKVAKQVPSALPNNAQTPPILQQ